MRNEVLLDYRSVNGGDWGLACLYRYRELINWQLREQVVFTPKVAFSSANANHLSSPAFLARWMINSVSAFIFILNYEAVNSIIIDLTIESIVSCLIRDSWMVLSDGATNQKAPRYHPPGERLGHISSVSSEPQQDHSPPISASIEHLTFPEPPDAPLTLPYLSRILDNPPLLLVALHRPRPCNFPGTTATASANQWEVSARKGINSSRTSSGYESTNLGEEVL